MQITETNVDAHLPVTAPAEAQPGKYDYPFDSVIWRTLHGHAPLGDLIWAMCWYDLYAAANERKELEISVDEHGTRTLDLYTDVGHSPFNRSRDQRVDIRGRDVINFVCVDPELTVRLNQGTDLEMTFESALLRQLGQELLSSRRPADTQATVAVGTATNENTGAQS